MFTWISKLLGKNGKRRPSAKRDTCKRRTARLDVEALESRLLLSSTPLDRGSEVIPPLHSNLGAERTLWLDFDGLHGEADDWGWNGPAEDIATGIGAGIGTVLSGGLFGGLVGGALGGLFGDAALPDPGTPRFDTNGQENFFSRDEVADMREIWARVSEDYAPFDVNVTTVRPADFGNGRSLRVSIGGDASWFPVGSAAGIGLPDDLLSFLDMPDYDTVFVFSQRVSAKFRDPDDPATFYGDRVIAAIADTASHEAGHGFGLHHQARFNLDNRWTPEIEDGRFLEEYLYGGDSHGPIMGDPNPGARTTWWVGQSSMQGIPFTETGPAQDDMAILARELGYRLDDHVSFVSSSSPPTPLTFVNSLDQDDRPFFNPVERVYEATGIIERTDDVDVFSIETNGRAAVQIHLVTKGPNLDPDVVLLDSGGNQVNDKGDLIISRGGTPVIATAATEFTLTIPRAGSWRLLVRAHIPTDEELNPNDCITPPYVTHGNVGQYQLTVRETSNPSVIDSWVTRNGNLYNEAINIHVRFDRPMNPATFTPAQIELRNGDGAVMRVRIREIHVVPGSGNTEFYIQRASAPIHGYTLMLRTGITDLFGNALDQDGNPANGRAPYQTSFVDTQAPQLQSAAAYDGFIRLTFSEAIDAGSFPRARITSLTDASGRPLTIVGAPRLVFGSGNCSWDISIAGTPVRGFNVRVGAAIRDLWGNTLDPRYRRVIVNDTQGPMVSDFYAVDETMPLPGLMANRSVVVTFNERIAATSFTAPDAASLAVADVVVRGPGGVLIPVVSVGPGPGPDQQSFVVTFTPPTGLAGSYTVTIGPDITDVYGNRMDQDGDGRIGLRLRDRGRLAPVWQAEADQDSYTSRPVTMGAMPEAGGRQDVETWFRSIMSGAVRLPPQLFEPGISPIDPLDPVIMERYFNEVLTAGDYAFTLSEELLTDLARLRRIEGGLTGTPGRLP